MQFIMDMLPGDASIDHNTRPSISHDTMTAHTVIRIHNLF